MKTVLQILISELEGLTNFPGVDKVIIQLAVDLAKQHLEEEKQMIIDVYWAGLNGSINDYSESKVIGNEIINIKTGGGAEQYYNETYID